MTNFGPCCYHNFVFSNVYFHYYNDLIKLLQSFLVILLCWYKRYSICLILFFSLYKSLPALMCDNNTGPLVNRLLIDFWLIDFIMDLLKLKSSKNTVFFLSENIYIFKPIWLSQFVRYKSLSFNPYVKILLMISLNSFPI